MEPAPMRTSAPPGGLPRLGGCGRYHKAVAGRQQRTPAATALCGAAHLRHQHSLGGSHHRHHHHHHHQQQQYQQQQRRRPRALLPPARVVTPDRAAAPAAPLAPPPKKADIAGPSTDLGVIYTRLQRLVLPYWQEEPSARWRLAGVVALTLATTGVSVTFNYLGRDFFNALSEKDVAGFKLQLIKYLAGFAVGIPVYVLKDYHQSRLALAWREWLTRRLLAAYFADRSFYQLQAGALVDNPDQRIAADVRQFTDAALGLSLVVLNGAIDLVSFSGILYSIYPPLFGALLAYSVGGTLASVALGRSLVGLNFNQEAVEADLRYSLVRVRENAESIAFYGGQGSEMAGLTERLRAVVANYARLLVASRNLDFFTSFYRFLIQLLPAAVVAPLFFAGKIEFGVINQSSSAFNHILNDVSLVVYQFETLAGFSAVIDRLGEFQEVVDVELRHGHPRVRRQRAAAASLSAAVAAAASAAATPVGSTDGGDGGDGEDALIDVRASAVAADGSSDGSSSAAGAAAAAAAWGSSSSVSSEGIQIVRVLPWQQEGGALEQQQQQQLEQQPLLELDRVSISTPDGGPALVRDLSLRVLPGRSLLIMGASGAGKTSVLRALAGLWQSGGGTIYSYGLAGLGDPGASAAAGASAAVGADGDNGGSSSSGSSSSGGSSSGDNVLFLPQRPYLPLGSLRDQLLYPTWARAMAALGDDGSSSSSSSNGSSNNGNRSSNGTASNGNGAAAGQQHEQQERRGRLPPSDERLKAVLEQVQLGSLLERCRAAAAAVAAVASSSSAAASSPPPSPPAGSQPQQHSPVGAADGGAGGLASALDFVADWAGILSLGEQQRLAFARLLLAAPKLALLDEATSALDTANEARLYRALAASGSTFISVGHRPTLVAYHRDVLKLAGGGGGGGWSLVPAAEVLAEQRAAAVAMAAGTFGDGGGDE